MNRILPLSTLLTGALLAGCASSPQQDSAKAPKGDGRCNAEPVQHLLEERITTDLAERARIESGAAQLRVTHPNQPVTMDYNSQRLNIDIDDAGVVLQVSCG